METEAQRGVSLDHIGSNRAAKPTFDLRKSCFRVSVLSPYAEQSPGPNWPFPPFQEVWGLEGEDLRAEPRG